MQNHISIWNAASTRTGMNEIQSASDELKEATVLRGNYDIVIANELSVFDWRFAMGQYFLGAPRAESIVGWNYAYDVPPQVLRVRRLMVDECVGQNYDLYGDSTLVTDAGPDQALHIDGLFDCNETFWPAYFTELVVLRLAALLATGVARDGEMAQTFVNQTVVQRKEARRADMQQQTTRNIRLTSLRSTRYGS